MKEKLIQQGLNWFDLEQSWILLYFSTSWCAPCKSMVPVMAEVKVQYKHQLKTVKVDVDVDVDENIELARMLDVRDVPTLVLLNEFEPRARLVGGSSIQQVERWLSLNLDIAVDELS